MSDISPLRIWLARNHFFVRSGDNIVYTHLLLDGGILHIPQDKNEIFLKKFSHDIDTNKKNYICENRTNIFKFMIDIDFIDEYTMTNELIENMVKDIQIAIVDFFQDTHTFYERRVIVCTTEPKNITIDNCKYIKTGIHLIWPDITVDKDYALILRSAIIQYFNKFKNSRPTFNKWEHIFDYSIYTSSGLRMIGSRKMSNCSKCKSNKNLRISCDMCFGKGKIDEGRIYKPTLIIDGNNNLLISELNELNENTFLMLSQTSIRTYENKPNIYIKNNYPSWFCNEIYQEHLYKPKIKKKKNKNNSYNPNSIQNNKDLKIRIKINSNDERYIKLKKFIKNIFSNNQNYKDMNLSALFLCGKNNDYYIFQSDSTYCQNVSREHNSNHIYFYINKKSIFQKCLSQTINKNNIPCYEYISRPININSKISRLLFPNIHTKQSENDFKNLAINDSFSKNINKYDEKRTMILLENLENYLFSK